MRGKVHCRCVLDVIIWITPAHAGKSKVMRGGKDKKMGSPPHMRGKVNLSQKPMRGGRITPAHAGKSPNRTLGFSFAGDHPRTCGEKHLVIFVNVLRPGSPPHMRGKDQRKAIPYRKNRITPAHAGKSAVWYVFFIVCQDHPRTCGEKSAVLLRM